MCGITGFITNETGIGASERRRWFINAIRAGVVRGDDGTGMFLVAHDQKGSADWCKIGAPPEAFLNTTQAQARLDLTNDWKQYRAVIGHNRSATIGSVSTANAHPFQEGPITLVHNGTLNSVHNLPTPKHKLKGADVDSHMIAHNLATHSVQDVVKQLDGAFVLVWHDARDQSVNIIRNEKRPLHIMPIKGHDTYLLASEAEMLWWLTDRSSFTPDGKIYYPEPGHLLKFLPGSHKPHVSKLEMHVWGNWKSNGGYGGGSRQWDDDDYGPWHSRGSGGVSGRQTNRPKTEGPNTGKGPSPSQPDGPYINQASLNRRLPRALTRTLEDYKLDCRDKLRFEVISVDEVFGRGSAVVRGRLMDVEQRPWCHLYGLSYAAVKDAKGEEIWTVAPNGVKDVGMGLRPIVLGRLLARSSVPVLPGLPVVIDQSQRPSVSSLSTGSGTSSTEAETVYYGPGETVVSAEEWIALTAKGCSICKEFLMIDFAQDVWWDTTTHEAVCGDCSEEILNDGDDIDYSKAV